MTARNHHYLSQCYLKGFTKDGAKDSKLFAIDLKLMKKFETIPRNVGSARDFNRVDAQGFDQNFIENNFSIFERKAATALSLLEINKDFSGEVKDSILNLIAFIAVRSPEKRERMRKFHADIAENIMGLSLASKERWERTTQEYLAANPNSKESVSYQDEKEYKINVAREFHIEMEMAQVDAILPCLHARNWMLLESTPTTGPFLTSDRPVSLSWLEPEKMPSLFKSSPGFGLKGTRLYFPISKNLALVGEFGIEDVVLNASPELVAVSNSITILSTNNQIYTSTMNFNFYDSSGEICSGNKLLQAITNK